MACGVKADRHAADLARLAVGNPLSRNLAQAVADLGQGLMGAQMGPPTTRWVVGMAGRDLGTGHAPHRVDVKTPFGAKQALRGLDNKGRACHAGRVAQRRGWVHLLCAAEPHRLRLIYQHIAQYFSEGRG